MHCKEKLFCNGLTDGKIMSGFNQNLLHMDKWFSVCVYLFEFHCTSCATNSRVHPPVLPADSLVYVFWPACVFIRILCVNLSASTSQTVLYNERYSTYFRAREKSLSLSLSVHPLFAFHRFVVAWVNVSLSLSSAPITISTICIYNMSVENNVFISYSIIKCSNKKK